MPAASPLVTFVPDDSLSQRDSAMARRLFNQIGRPSIGIHKSNLELTGWVNVTNVSNDGLVSFDFVKATNGAAKGEMHVADIISISLR